MTGPIIQIPYLRPDPIHEIPGGLGSLGQSAGQLAQFLQGREQGQALAGLRDVEAKKADIQARELQQRAQAEQKYRDDFEKAVLKLPPEMQDRVRVLSGLAHLPASLQNHAAQALFPMHRMDPQLAAGLGNLIVHGGMKAGDAAQIMGVDATAWPQELQNFKAPKTPAAIAQEGRERLSVLSKSWAATNRQIEDVQTKLGAFERQYRLANGPQLGERWDNNQTAAFEQKVQHASALYRKQIAPNYAGWLQQRELTRTQMLSEAGIVNAQAPGLQPQGEDLESRVQQILQLYNSGNESPGTQQP